MSVEALKLQDVNALLQKPQPAGVNLLPRATGEFFADLMNSNDRIELDLPQSEQSFAGTWYEQTPNACLIWAVTNGINILNLPVNPELLVQMYEVKARNSIYRKERLDDFLDAGKFIRPTYGGILKYSRIERRFPNEGADFEAGTREYADTVREYIGRGAVILDGVRSGDFFNTGSKNDHAFCISGFRIGNRRHMDLQVVEPHHGIYWVPVEHMNRSRYSYVKAYQMSRPAEEVAA